MTPVTKEWISQIRARASKLHAGSDTNPWNDLEDALIHIERLEEIIESQEKEIERMKDVLLLVLSDGDFYVGKEREWIGTKTAYMLRKVFGL